MATQDDSSRAAAPEERTPPADIVWRTETSRYFRRPGGWWWAALLGVPLVLTVTGSGFPALATPPPASPASSTPFGSAPVTASPTSTPPSVSQPTSPSASTTPAIPPPISCDALAKDVERIAGSGQIRFGYKSSNPTTKGIAAIATAGNLLKFCPTVPVKIRGFADLTGPAKVNKKISVTRAKTVRQQLRALGVTNPVTVTGLGDKHSVANNSSAKGRAANRRAEIVIP